MLKLGTLVKVIKDCSPGKAKGETIGRIGIIDRLEKEMTEHIGEPCYMLDNDDVFFYMEEELELLEDDMDECIYCENERLNDLNESLMEENEELRTLLISSLLREVELQKEKIDMLEDMCD